VKITLSPGTRTAVEDGSSRSVSNVAANPSESIDSTLDVELLICGGVDEPLLPPPAPEVPVEN